MTCRELDALSGRQASLEAAGLRPGDAVALQLSDIPQFLVAYFGILKAGGVAVPLNVLLKAPEVAFYLGDSRAKILITWEGVLSDAAKGAAAAGVSEIYAVGHTENAPGAHPFGQLLAVADGPRLAPRMLTDTAVIVYTSGTTRPSQGGRRLWRASAAQHPLAARAAAGRGVAGDAGGRGARGMLAITPAMRTQMAKVQQGCGV